jgi:hypothetical protein
VVPCSQCLLRAVEGLVEPTHLLRVSRVNKAGWLTAINYLGECDMEEGVLDIELVHSPTRGDIQSRHNLDGDRLDDRVEGLIIVHTGALSEPPEDPTNLVPAKRVICLDLVLKDPLTGDDVGPRRSRNQVPCVVRHQGLVLLHSTTLAGSVSAPRIEVGTGDSVGGAAAAESCRRSTGLVTLAARRVTIGWVLQGS